ncbi:MAG: type II toxin-antitoxin system VapC family toxin [Alphaproteobacteria bacterium]|nr:type II toxin-antitoxin system VapC family toxin [Alphaproteobacteria bacterium]
MVYLDTSILVPYFLTEPTSARVEDLLRRQVSGQLATSHLARLEFTAVLARQARMGRIDAAAIGRGEATFDAIVDGSMTMLGPELADYDLARTYLRRHETGLRAPDALHLAIAANQHATAIYTLDAGMLKAGRLLGLPVRAGIRTA